MTDNLLLLIHTLVHWDTLATIWLNGGHTDIGITSWKFALGGSYGFRFTLLWCT